MLLCVILLWPSKIENFLILMQNVFEVWDLRKYWLKILFLGDLGSIQVFWKTFHLILMHSIHKIPCFKEFLHKISLFFKNLFFLEFRSIEHISQPIEIVIKNLFWICLARLVLDQSNAIFDRSNLFFDQSKIVRVF